MEDNFTIKTFELNCDHNFVLTLMTCSAASVIFMDKVGWIYRLGDIVPKGNICGCLQRDGFSMLYV